MAVECFDQKKIPSLNELTCCTLSYLARPFDQQELLRFVLTGIKELTGSNRCDLLLYQSDMNILFFSESIDSNSENSGKGGIGIADTKNSAPVQALTGGHTVYVNDIADSGLLGISSGSKTLLAVPIIYGDRLHGVMNVEHSSDDAYRAETVRSAESLASIIASILEQSYLSERVFQLNQKVIELMTEGIMECDPGFREHAERVSRLAVAIAQKLGLEQRTIDTIRDSGLLHDIGKSGVNEAILVKPGSLSEEEFSEMKKHPVLGRFLLKPLGFQPGVIEGVASHHERWDGNGYPRGLEGEQIPISGRILAVAEAFDVMTSDQPYRDKMSQEDALRDISNNAGGQFDPSVVEALMNIDLERE